MGENGETSSVLGAAHVYFLSPHASAKLLVWQRLILTVCSSISAVGCSIPCPLTPMPTLLDKARASSGTKPSPHPGQGPRLRVALRQATRKATSGSPCALLAHLSWPGVLDPPPWAPRSGLQARAARSTRSPRLAATIRLGQGQTASAVALQGETACVDRPPSQPGRPLGAAAVASCVCPGAGGRVPAA